jgi:hypothetical protein
VSVNPDISVANNNNTINTYLAWEQFILPGYGLPFIASVNNTDGGSTFSKIVNVTDAEPPNWPKIAASSGNEIFVVFESTKNGVDRNSPSGIVDVFLSKSTDGGSTFSKPVDLSNNPDTEGNKTNIEDSSHFPNLSVTDNEKGLYVVWQQKTDRFEALQNGSNRLWAKTINSSIFLSKSTDDGSTFSKPVNVSETIKQFNRPFLVFTPPDIITSKGINNNKTLFVAWHQEHGVNETDTFFTKSTDGGSTFSKPIDLSGNARYALSPKIAESGGNVYVMWEQTPEINPPSPRSDVLLSKSTDGGSTFSKPMDLSDVAGIEDCVNPSLTASENGLFVVCEVSGTGPVRHTDIFFTKSTDGGSTFSKPINVSNLTGIESSLNPTIASSGNNLFITWIGRNQTDDVFFSKSTDGGSTFSKPTDLIDIAGKR